MPESIDQPRTDAQAVFLELIEAAPEEPLAALEALRLGEPLHGRVERMVVAYLRTRRLERELAATDGAIARAIAEAEIVPMTTADRTIPGQLRGYRIERVLGESPNAAVLLAHQESPIERSVAIKLLFADATDPRVAARAELERQILASLEHPNIARIYDFGIDELSRPYLVMEHVRGGAVDAWCAGRRLGERELVERVFLGIASAVRFAHAHGVLHCDLKCANVLVQVVDGEPHAKVIDFGIARAMGGALAERAGLAELPRAIGTLASLSPEALDPAAPQLDARTDVFGLGIILLELAGGRPARQLEGADLAAALRSLVDRPVPRLRSISPSASADLDAIVARATATRPSDRYQTVAALVADIEEYLGGREVAARRRSVAERAAGIARRHWRIGLASTLLVGSVVAWARLEAARSRARVEEVMADTRSALEEARSIRNSAGRAGERDALVARAIDGSRTAGLLEPGSIEVMELRAGAVEEAILPRLARGDHKSRETIMLVDELVRLREDLAAASGESPQALERLSVALAYQCDTVRGTDRHEALENRQIALDEALHAGHPDSVVFADNLCWTYQRVHHDMWMRGDRARSLECLRKSSRLGEEILERHGRTPITLYTATSAALYGGMAAGSSGDLDGKLAGLQRAQALGAELLQASPDHYRGASFLLRAGIGEAIEWVDRGEYARAEAALSGSRKHAERVVSSERGVGFLGFTLAESWAHTARIALLRGEVALARAARGRLVEEMEAERPALEREQSHASFEAERDVLEARIALAEGRTAEARTLLESVLSSLLRLPSQSPELDACVDAIIAQFTEMPRDGLAEEFLDELEPLLDRSEALPDGGRQVRPSRGWFEFLRGDADGLRAGIEDFRRNPRVYAALAYEGFRLERALRTLEARKEESIDSR